LAEIWYGVSKWKDSTYVYDLYAFEHANRPNRPTIQPAYWPNSEKPAYLQHFSTNLVETWYGVFKWKNSTYAHYISCQTSLPPNQPTSLKVKNVHIFGIFHLIWLKSVMESLNGRVQLMNVIYMHLSMLTGLTSLPTNHPSSLKVKNGYNLAIFLTNLLESWYKD